MDLPAILAGLYGLLVVGSLVRWAGLPSQRLPLFLVGVASIFAMLAALGFLAWYLLLRRRSTPEAAAHPLLGVAQRQGLAAVLTISGIMIVIGAFWDEVWHRSYGVPFGEDLLWRPHLLLYIGMLLVSLAAAYGLVVLWRGGRGNLRQRFRADPHLGWLVLLGAFFVYAIPADPAWHQLYGADITAWSVPHLILMSAFAAIMVLAVALQYSLEVERPWRGVHRIGPLDLLVGVATAFALKLGLQLLTTEWDGITAIVQESANPFWQRPEWLLPVLIVGLAGFFGTLAVHASRLIGMATLIGLAALTVRWLLVGFFGRPGITADAWLLALPPLIALDLWFAAKSFTAGRLAARRRSLGTQPVVFGSAVAATLGMALGSLPLLDMLYLYPRVTVATMLPMLAFGFLTALWSCWLGTRVGAALGPGAAVAPLRQAAAQRQEAVRVASGAGIAVLVTAGFIGWFIASASPPV